MKPWPENDKVRFLLEIKLLRRSYPDARPIISNGLLMVSNKFQGKRAAYMMKIEYPVDFPWSAPSAFITKPRIAGAKHIFDKGQLCLYTQKEVGPQTSGKVILDWAIAWLRAYEAWLDSGRTHWPSIRHLPKT